MTDADRQLQPAGHRRRPWGAVSVLLALALMWSTAGCGGPKKFPDGVPGKGPDEIAATSNAARHYQRGIELYDAGRYRKAIKSFHASVRLNPGDPRPYLEIGACYNRLGDAERELAAYDKALAISPDFVPAHNSRGVALLGLDRVDEAVEAFGRALKREVNYAPAHINIAIAYGKLGKYDLALMSLKNAAQFDGPPFDIQFNMGLVLVELDRYDDAAAAFERAMRERPGHNGVRFNRALALGKAGRHHEAILEFERITTLQPEFALAYLEKARLLSGGTRLQYSINQYAEYLQRVPKDAQVWSEVGNVHYACGQYAQAEACYRSAIKYRRDFYDAYLNLAVTLDQLGRTRQAKQARKRAERYAPETAPE